MHDQEFVANLCPRPRPSSSTRTSRGPSRLRLLRNESALQTAARNFDYGFFATLVWREDPTKRIRQADKIATGQHARRSAGDGLSGWFGARGSRARRNPSAIRWRMPLLKSHRKLSVPCLNSTLRTREYLTGLGQQWREDSTMPMPSSPESIRSGASTAGSAEFNPAVAEGLSELAEIARGEEDYWENEISGWFGNYGCSGRAGMGSTEGFLDRTVSQSLFRSCRQILS